jgi:putative hemolysin
VNEILFECLIISLLLLINGLFAMTEVAVISARKNRLRNMADEGKAGAKAALDLAESPNQFLSTIQIGITLIGIFAGAYGGATIAEQISKSISTIPLLKPYDEMIGVGIVVAVITYASLIIGELVPKRIGLGHSEQIAVRMSRPMQWLAKIAKPIVFFLSKSTELSLKALPIKEKHQTAVTVEEVDSLLQEGLRAGVFNKIETAMVKSVLELDELPVRNIMTPRPKIIWLNKEDPHEAVWHKIVVSNHSNFPVYEGTRDNVVGIVSVKAIYANLAIGVPVRLGDLMTKPLVVPAIQNVIALLETFKQHGKYMALVTDEFGNIVGIVTLHDVMEAIGGEFPSQEERSKPIIKRREDGTWLIDAVIEFEKVAEALPNLQISKDDSKDFQTLAGFVVKQLGHLPKEGETFEYGGYVVEVLDMDRHRVDKVLVTNDTHAKSGLP